MTESEKKPKWEFKEVLFRDYINKLRGTNKENFIALVQTAAEATGISWKQVQLYPLSEGFEFMGEFAKSQNFPTEFAFLGKK